jgi:serine/threonine protein kinase
MDQFTGQIFHDRYQLQSLLGHQTGRRAFLAQDLQTGCAVVVKLLLFGPDFTWDDLKLFERETAVLKFLDHPAIPKYLDCFSVETELGKGFALVQTYVEAPSLRHWIESGRTFSQDDLKTIAKALLAILDYLHSQDPPVIHRDIKPSNILLGDRSGNSLGQIYLVDFDSIQTVVHNTGTRTIVGTYGYMPPEQFGGESSPASDLYALGATLIHLATGERPDRLPQQGMQMLFADRVSLSPNLVDWLKWLTEPDVETRLSSVKQALEALEQEQIRASSLSRLRKPDGTRIKITSTPQILEIIAPAHHNTAILGLVGLAIAGSSVGTFVFGAIFGSMLLGLFGVQTVSIFSFDLPGYLFAGICAVLLTLLPFLKQMIFTIFRVKTKLQVTQSSLIVETQWLFGKIPSKSINLDRITELEITAPYTSNSEGNRAAIPVWLNILVAGADTISIGDRWSLTPPEIDWIAESLSDRLGIPIRRPSIID